MPLPRARKCAAHCQNTKPSRSPSGARRLRSHLRMPDGLLPVVNQCAVGALSGSNHAKARRKRSEFLPHYHKRSNSRRLHDQGEVRPEGRHHAGARFGTGASPDPDAGVLPCSASLGLPSLFCGVARDCGRVGRQGHLWFTLSIPPPPPFFSSTFAWFANCPGCVAAVLPWSSSWTHTGPSRGT
jgi:hypothetical protein